MNWKEKLIFNFAMVLLHRGLTTVLKYAKWLAAQSESSVDDEIVYELIRLRSKFDMCMRMDGANIGTTVE